MTTDVVTANQVAHRIARLLQPSYFEVVTGEKGKKYGGSVTLDQAPEWLNLKAKFGLVWNAYQQCDMKTYWLELIDLDWLASKSAQIALGLAISDLAKSERFHAVEHYNWHPEQWWHPSFGMFLRLLPNYRPLISMPTEDEIGSILPPPDLKALALGGVGDAICKDDRP